MHENVLSNGNPEELERFGTVSAWSTELNIRIHVLRRRLKDECSISGIDSRGRTRSEGFFAESVVREKCADLLREDLLTADDDGFIQFEDERWGTTKAWSGALLISESALSRRLVKAEGMRGKNSSGSLRNFFPEKLVRGKCADFLNEDLLEADESGFAIHNDEVWGTVPVLAGKLEVDKSTISKKLRGEIGVKGKDKDNRIKTFYSESLVREKCTGLLQEGLLQADDSGFFRNAGELWGTISAFEKVLPIGESIISSRLDGEQGIQAKNKAGHLAVFYPEGLVREKCADHLREGLHVADGDGFIWHNDERHATIYKWGMVLKLSPATVGSRLDGISGMEGKSSIKRIGTFYPESLVREKCADLLQEDLLTADDDGFIQFKSEQWGTVVSWSRMLPISTTAISKRLDGEKGIRGKDKMGGNIFVFYPESLVLEKCADLLQEDLPTADDDGFIQFEGERWGTIRAWSRALLVSDPILSSRLIKEEGISGKDNSGSLRSFFPEDLVRKKCANLLRKNVVQTDDHGFINRAGERWGTIQAWNRKFSLSEKAISKRLKDEKGIKVRISNGIRTFYAESLVRQKLSDLLGGDLPVANNEGVIYHDDDAWRTAYGWSKMFSLGGWIISSRLKELGMQGRDRSKIVRIFFSERLVREKCADLLSKKDAQ